MRRRYALALVVFTGVAHAGPRKVLVLPLDGSVDPTTRARLNAAVEMAARGAGTVTVGDTTFEEAATAVGCDPGSTACADQVRKTTGYDVMVYGTATTKHGATTLVIKRVGAQEKPRTDRVALAAGDPPERAEEKLRPAFTSKPAGGGGSKDAGGDPGAPTDDTATITGDPSQPEEPAYDNGKRNKGIVLVAAGGVLVLSGVIAWTSASATQDDVDDAPTQTPADFARLEDLEDRAQTFAILGNVLVAGGLVAGGIGAWVLYQDRKERRMVITPSVTPTTAALTIGGMW